MPVAPSQIVNIVATCSNRKSMIASPALQVRNLPKGSTSRRSQEWIRRLTEEPPAAFRPAIDLYQGDHWATIREIVRAGTAKAGTRVNVWIASAGCGLISPCTLVPAYGATFSMHNLDSVVLSPEDRRGWWHTLTSFHWGDPELPRSVSAIAQTYPGSVLLVAGSPEYLDAVADDLAIARTVLCDSEGLSILCREGSLRGQLEGCKVPVSADLSSLIGGSLNSLGARILRWLITDGPDSLRYPEVLRVVDGLRQRATPRKVPLRCKSTDEEIKGYIRSLLSSNKRLSGSAALSAFRGDGKAAEQKRFQYLFRTVKEEVHVG